MQAILNYIIVSMLFFIFQEEFQVGFQAEFQVGFQVGFQALDL